MHVENFVYTIGINKIKSKDETILGIYCFDELLLESDIRDYARKYFSKDINIDGLFFCIKITQSMCMKRV